MSFTFEDVEYNNTNAGGRAKGVNPFSEVIAEIALKTDPKTKKPLVKAFTIASTSADEHVTDVNRARRQLVEAGKDNDPTVSVQSRAVPMKSAEHTSVITFWTIKRIVREAKPKQRETTTK